MNAVPLKFMLVVGLLFIGTIVAAAFSYSGYSEAVSTCVEANKQITENDLGFMAFNWSVSCGSGVE
ncbi:hypothetical protein [Alkalicoccus luteus]|uniref:hypothetical protein n=1 Tax=Alkalicoccus luteus TaxID=1237094 RepID=UPI0040341E5C